MKTIATIFSLLIAVFPAGASSPESVKVANPDSALAKLRSGNLRHVAGTPAPARPAAELRRETARGQHPFAIVVGCSDSRTAPEIVFDQNLGDLFVIRTAGNLAGDHALGSIEYAVEHLGVRLIVVMGHRRCGAVTAAMSGDSAPAHIQSIVRDIRPAVEAAGAADAGGDPLANAVRANARRVAARIRAQGRLVGPAPAVRVVTAYHDLETGVVTWGTE